MQDRQARDAQHGRRWNDDEIVPLDINEGLIDKQRMRDRASGEFIPDAALEVLHGAMAEARQTAEKIAALAEAIGNDKTITPEAGALKLDRPRSSSVRKLPPNWTRHRRGQRVRSNR